MQALDAKATICSLIYLLIDLEVIKDRIPHPNSIDRYTMRRLGYNVLPKDAI